MIKQLLGLALAICLISDLDAQSLPDSEGERGIFQLNTITTAVPFLLITPDTRAGGLGDVGVATSPDGNSLHWNMAKMAFMTDFADTRSKSSKPDLGVSLTYNPWLRTLVSDMSLSYLSGYKIINDKQAVSAGLRFFSLGVIDFTDNVGSSIRSFEPIEFSFDLGFSQKLSDNLSGGFTARYIYSNLTGGIGVNGASSQPGSSAAADISFFYTQPEISIGGKSARVNAGMNISNIGAKISYTETADRDFLPANLRLGSALTINLDDFNALTFATDFNKLLVPTPPIYEDGEVAFGKDPDVGVAAGIFNSFSDAPGIPALDAGVRTGEAVPNSVLREELREINISTGLEYVYANQFAFRTGFFHEHASKGNRQYITLGFGLKFEVFSLDMSYLVSTRNQNPLANTLRFGLNLNLTQGSSEGASE